MQRVIVSFFLLAFVCPPPLCAIPFIADLDNPVTIYGDTRSVDQLSGEILELPTFAQRLKEPMGVGLLVLCPLTIAGFQRGGWQGALGGVTASLGLPFLAAWTTGTRTYARVEGSSLRGVYSSLELSFVLQDEEFLDPSEPGVMPELTPPSRLRQVQRWLKKPVKVRGTKIEVVKPELHFTARLGTAPLTQTVVGLRGKEVRHYGDIRVMGIRELWVEGGRSHRRYELSELE